MGLPESVRAVDGGHIKGAQTVPLCYEIVLLQALPNSKIAHMKLHGRYTAPGANMQNVVNNLFTAISAAWSSRLGALMHTSSSLLSAELRDMAATTNPVFVSQGTATAGTGIEDAMPVQDCIVLTEHVNMRGKGLSGRTYWSGWTTAADAGGGQISAAAQTAMNGFGTDIFAAIQAMPATPCVAQVERAAYISLTGATIQHRPANTATVSSYTCKDLFWDTQRRRDVR